MSTAKKTAAAKSAHPATSTTSSAQLVRIEHDGQTAFGFVVDTRPVDAVVGVVDGKDKIVADAYTEAHVATLGGDVITIDAADVEHVKG